MNKNLFELISQLTNNSISEVEYQQLLTESVMQKLHSDPLFIVNILSHQMDQVSTKLISTTKRVQHLTEDNLRLRYENDLYRQSIINMQKKLDSVDFEQQQQQQQPTQQESNCDARCSDNELSTDQNNKTNHFAKLNSVLQQISLLKLNEERAKNSCQRQESFKEKESIKEENVQQENKEISFNDVLNGIFSAIQQSSMTQPRTAQEQRPFNNQAESRLNRSNQQQCKQDDQRFFSLFEDLLTEKHMQDPQNRDSNKLHCFFKPNESNVQSKQDGEPLFVFLDDFLKKAISMKESEQPVKESPVKESQQKCNLNDFLNIDLSDLLSKNPSAHGTSQADKDKYQEYLLNRKRELIKRLLNTH